MIFKFLLTVLLVMVKWGSIGVNCRGVDLGLCDDTRFQCQCGKIPSSAVRLPIEQCTFFHRWKPSCKPCNKITEYDVCPKYKNCLTCHENNEKDNGCTSCPDKKYGNWCDQDCQCLNGGSCDRSGSCYCLPNYEGRFCEVSKVKECPIPQDLSNGKLTYSSRTSGATVQYSCNPQYKLRGSTYNRCSQTGFWQMPLPRCVKECEIPQSTSEGMHMQVIRGELDTPSKGQSKVTFQIQSKATIEEDLASSLVFSCRTGYVLNGVQALHCLDGQWSSPVPSCEQTCALLASPENGIITMTPSSGNIAPGTTLTVTCNTGYQPNYNAAIKCQENGTWSHPLPTCVPLVLCNDPGLPSGASREAFAPFTAGKSIKYKCNDNAIMVGEHTIVCGSDAKWSYEVPSCITVSDKAVTCQTKGSEVVGEVNKPIRVQCPSGCGLDQSAIWGTVIYEMESSICKAAIHSGKITDNGGPLLIINNGQYAGFVSSVIHSISSQSKDGFSGSFRFSSLPPQKFGENGLTLECPGGWKEIDDVCVLIVEKAKAWQAAHDICINLDSKLIEINQEKLATLRPFLQQKDDLVKLAFWYGRKCAAVSYEVRKPLSIVTDLSCDEIKLFMCQIQLLSKGAKCTDPGTVHHSERNDKNVINGVFYEGSTVSYSCTRLHYLSGQKTIRCTSEGTWSSPTPTCKRIPACQDLPSPNNAFLEYTDPIPSSAGGSLPASRAAFPGRRLHPALRRPNIPLSLTAPINLTAPDLSNIDIPDGYQRSGSRAIVTCKSQFYKRTGSRVRTCGSDGQWSGSVASCHPICGQSSAPRNSFVVNGTATNVGQWPWQVGIAAWWPENSSYFISCGGSLINEYWIVTAAHCVTFTSTKIVIPASQFRLYLGKHYRNNTQDDEFVQRHQIAQIHVHPNYDPIQYDSDIALIKLKKPAKLTVRVRPICLPTFKSANEHLTEGTVGVVIGWGILEENTYASELQQAKLPIVSSRQCTQDYRSADIPLTITDYMFCAGYKEGRTDTCSGDSGGPMMFQDTALKSWIIEGIVSWGSPNGCGHANQYGGFTRVERFLNWMQEFL